eukprot:scaffold4498_cov320-Prasinococcus_capsulatus_cf.AAC.1
MSLRAASGPAAGPWGYPPNRPLGPSQRESMGLRGPAERGIRRGGPIGRGAERPPPGPAAPGERPGRWRGSPPSPPALAAGRPSPSGSGPCNRTSAEIGA